MRFGYIAVLVILAVSGLNTSAARAGEGELKQLDALLEEAETAAMFNGFILVERNGEPLFQRAYGFANYEHEVEINAETRFRIASLSKPMTDAAVAVLIANGEWTLDTRVSDFLPDFPGASSITVEHLMNHRSGIPHTNRLPWGDGNESVQVEEIITRLASLPLDFEPGTQRGYSNGGYAVLARMLELETGMTYGALMDALVFAPLGMTDTGHIADSRDAIEDMANGYEPGRTFASRRHSRPYAVETRPGGGSLYSTPVDVARFFRAIWLEGFPNTQSNIAVFGPATAVRQADGRSPGFNMAIRYETDTGLFIVSMANNYAADFQWSRNIADIVEGREPLYTGIPDPAADSTSANLAEMVGFYRYESTNFSQELELVRSADGSFFIEDRASGTSSALVPTADGRLFDPLYFGLCSVVSSDRISCDRIYSEGFTADIVRR